MTRVLFICTGNICRSPTAEGVFRQLVRQRGRERDFEIASAGIHGYHQGEPPDPRSIATARQFGVDLSGQRARKVRNQDLDDYDVIAVMEAMHRRHLLALRPRPPKAEIRLLLSWLGRDDEVPDPYYDDGRFIAVYRLIEQGCLALLDQV